MTAARTSHISQREFWARVMTGAAFADYPSGTAGSGNSLIVPQDDLSALRPAIQQEVKK